MKKYFFNFLSFVLSIILIYFLLSKIEIEQLIKSVVNFSFEYYVIAMVLYFSVLILTAYRIKLFFPQQNYFILLLIACIHNFVNRVLPLRLGEFVLPIMLKKVNIRLFNSFSAILSVRLLDLVVSLFTFFVVFLIFGLGGEKFKLFAIIFLSICSGLIFYHKKLLKFFTQIIYKIFSSKYFRKINKSISKENNIYNENFKYGQLLLVTFLRKIIFPVFSIMVILSLGYDLKIDQVIFASISSGFTEILPINSFGNFGTLELGWAGGLIYFGVPSEIAIESGFALHMLAFSMAIIIGIIAFCSFLLFKNNMK